MRFSNLIALLIVLFSLTNANSLLQAQTFSCATLDSNAGSGSNPSATQSGCSVDVKYLNKQTVRVIVHVFQDDNGNNNIPNTTAGRQHIGYLIGKVNSHLSNLKPIQNPASPPSAYFPDSKIRISMDRLIFHKNTTMSKKGRKIGNDPSALYNFVMAQNIPNKDHAIHILIPGNNIEGGAGGVACGIGCGKWAMIENVYSQYVNGGNWWDPGKTLTHEIGHNLGLRHAYNPDGCNDTKQRPYVWNDNNNIMDYNPHINGLTGCQAGKMHSWLESNRNYVVSYEYSNQGLTLAAATPDGYNGSVSAEVTNLQSSSATINITSSGVSNFTWRLTKSFPGSGNYSVSGNGKQLSLTNLVNLTFELSFTVGCKVFTRTYQFISIIPTQGFATSSSSWGNLNLSLAKVAQFQSESKEQPTIFPNPLRRGNQLSLVGFRDMDDSVPLRITDVNGRTVATILASQMTSGTYSDSDSANLSPGVYVVSWSRNKSFQSTKLIVAD